MRPGPLKPGNIIVLIKSKFYDIPGTINTVLQGDTKAKHACWVLPSGKIASTGAEFGVLYGEYDPETYLKDKNYFILKTLDPLTEGQLAIMQQCHNQLMNSGIKRFYGFWKFAILEALALHSGLVSKTGLSIKTDVPDFPICSQAVAYPFWSAGIRIGEALGKEDWTAVLPETILAEAQESYYRRDSLLMGVRPCYAIETVEPLPFSGSPILA